VRFPNAIPDDEPLALPARAPDGRGAPFPLVASIAPLAASLVIWAITQSPFALIFAALSPIVAIAGLADAGRQRRKNRKRDTADRAVALKELEEQVRVRQDRERRERVARHPTAWVILGEELDGALRWKGTADSSVIALGRGAVASGLRIRGEATTEAEATLRSTAGVLTDAVIDADSSSGIGLIGPLTLTRAIARGYLVQLAHGIPPRELRISSIPGQGWDWATQLPQYRASRARNPDRTVLDVCVIETSDEPAASVDTDAGARATVSTRSATIALAATAEQLPMGCRTVIRVEGPSVARIVTQEEQLIRGDDSSALIKPELVTAESANAFAERLRSHANAVGIVNDRRQLPARLDLAELSQQRSDTGLSATIGIATDGPLTLDLVEDGPHALVGGTTGSGKSELLITWVASLARNYGPETVTFLLVDFKGGSAFSSLATLPHCVGVITDLAHGEADRALNSLAAEIRFRERTLAEYGARDIAELAEQAELTGLAPDSRCGRLARLVIVVDEFAAMIEAFPALHALFADLVARGRSLGIHVVLSTQRPAGVVRDAVIANCALRLSLRVHSAADSTAVVGTPAAAELSAAEPGRCVINRDGRQILAQLAVTPPALITSVADSAVSALAPRRPWLDPLPPRIPVSRIEPASPGTVILGLEDRPEEQRQSPAEYRLSDGSLLILGARGTGKSGALVSAASQWGGPCLRIPVEIEGAWDALAELASYCGVRTIDHEERLILIDDLDSLVSRLPDEYQVLAIERLTTILRDGPAAGLGLIVTAQRITPPLRSASTLFAETLLLGLPSKQEHVLSGGQPELFEPRARPGLASWRGHRLQLTYPGDSTPLNAGEALTIESSRHGTSDDGGPGWRGDLRVVRPAAGSVLAIVCRSASRRAEELRARDHIQVIDVAELGHGDGIQHGSPDLPLIVIGDPDTWQARWSVLTTLRARFDVLFEGCSIPEFRAVLRSRELPPVLGPGSRHAWLAQPNGTVLRAVLD
jgi:S-DNA-T family DNA segregation ATPase FtsK/SpoIIIE